MDVKKAVSFAIRLYARGGVAPVCSMAKKLLPLYEQWAADPALDKKDHRSVESAVKVLRQASS